MAADREGSVAGHSHAVSHAPNTFAWFDSLGAAPLAAACLASGMAVP